MKKTSICFYVLAVLFLVIAIFLGVTDYLELVKSAKDYGVNILEEWLTVFKSILTTSSGFVGFSAILCGIGLILNKLDK